MLPKTLKSVVVLACGVLVLTGLAAGHLSGLSAGPSRHGALAAQADSGPAAQAPAKDAPAAPRDVKRSDLFATLELLHRVLFNLLHQGGASAKESEGSDDKKDNKDKAALSGVWVLKGGELKVEFADKNVMKIFPHGDNPVIVIICQYTLDKEGRVKAKISELEGKDEAKEKAKDHVPVGLEFSFKWKVKDDTSKLDDVKGDKVDGLKSHLEGDYELKK